MNRIRPLSLGVAATALVVVGTALPAAANDDEVIRRGDCSVRADWKLKVGPEDGRLEVEGEIDTNRSGEKWRWRLRHNGALVDSGTRYTGGASGSFEVRRVVANLSGPDTLVFRARRPATGEVCRGVVTF